MVVYLKNIMRRGSAAFLLIVFVIVVFAGKVFSQAKVEWRKFAPEGEEFATEAPSELVEPRTGTDQPLRFYKARVGQTFFFVYSSRARDPYTEDDLEYLRRFQPSGKSEQRGEITVERFSFDDGGGFHHE